MAGNLFIFIPVVIFKIIDMALEKGTKAPDFKLPSTGGSFQLYKNVRNEACILYFYPKDFTAGCTREACDFRDHFSYFRNLGIRVIGISFDDVETHRRFQKKYKLPFELLSDTSGKVAQIYDAKVPIFNMSKRITYLLDKNLIIRGVYSNFFDGAAHVKEMKEMVGKVLQY